MKKHWGVFLIIETIMLLGALAAVISLAMLYWMLAMLAAIFGGIGAAAYWLHFSSLTYTLEAGCIVIRKGVLVKSRREIYPDGVLMVQSVKVFGYTLYTSVKTAGGSAVLFCDVNLNLAQ